MELPVTAGTGNFLGFVTMGLLGTRNRDGGVTAEAKAITFYQRESEKRKDRSFLTGIHVG